MSITYTPLAEPLQDFIAADLANTSTGASTLLTPINYNADLFADHAAFLSGNYGFDGYMGVPGLSGTAPQQAASRFNVAWQTVDPSLAPAQRALTAAASLIGTASQYGVTSPLLDTMPLVFSYPVLPTSLNGDGSDFAVTLNDGSVVTPLAAGLLPNLEHNERQTVVILGDFGNRRLPGTKGARYPVSIEIVNNNTPLQMLSAKGPIDAVGLSIASQNPYVEGNGPKLVAAKLNSFSPLGEGGPAGVGAGSSENSGADVYGDQAQYRLRTYTSAGFSPDGISSLFPDDFSTYFSLEAVSSDGQTIQITEANEPYSIGSDGFLTVVGIADLAPAGTTVNAAYVEDHDNYYDIILEGDPAAIQALRTVRMPSGNGYQAVYNPGGPGNAPNAPGAASGPFTVPSQDHTTPIQMDLHGERQATFVEVDGAVLRNPVNLLPVGRLLGVAVKDTVSGQTINAYRDPDGKVFYASFAASPDQAPHLPIRRTDLQPIDLIDSTAFSSAHNAADDTVTVSGSFSHARDHDGTLHFYAVADAEGGVEDPVSGTTLKPGETGYAAAALSGLNRLTTAGSSLRPSTASIQDFSFDVAAGQRYAPVFVSHSESAPLFAYAEANLDGLQHFTRLGANRWGLEATLGGGNQDYGDFNLLFSVSN